MTALVLGLLLASAKSSYGTQNNYIKELTSQSILLDQALAQYGDEARGARRLLRRSVVAVGDQIWAAPPLTHFTRIPEGEQLYQMLYSFKEQTVQQQVLHPRIIDISTGLARTRLSLFTQMNNQIPFLFYFFLVLCLTIIFTSFGLLSRPQLLAGTALFLCIACVCVAVFLILQLNQPFTGVMPIDKTPLLTALDPLQ